MDTLKETGDFQAHTNTRSQATAEVVRLIFEEFWRLQRDSVGERELSDAKAYLSGSFPLTIETPDAIAMQVLNVLFYDLPIEDLQSFRERVNAVTTDDIERVAKAYLRARPAVRRARRKCRGFCVGSAERGIQHVRNSGAQESRSHDCRFQAPGPEACEHRPTAISADCVPTAGGATARIGSSGGRGKGEGVARPGDRRQGWSRKAAFYQDHHCDDVDDDDRAGRTRSSGRDYVLEYPNHVRVETKLQDVASVQVFDGEHAWVRDQSGVHDVPERFTRDLQMSLKRDTITLLLAAERGAIRTRILPDVQDEAGKRYHALELSGTDLEPVVLYLDPRAIWFRNRRMWPAALANR